MSKKGGILLITSIKQGVTLYIPVINQDALKSSTLNDYGYINQVL